jgi:hypothetical protein
MCYVLYCSLEAVQGVIDPEKGIPAVVRRIEKALRFSNIPESVKFAKDAD